MCGIGGWFGSSMAAQPHSVVSALRHRGPDGQGIWQDSGKPATLVHTRLAIIDLSECGAQPMGTGQNAAQAPADDGLNAQSARYWIVFNGEIYNFQALRAELEAAGETFGGHSDTEVLLKLLIRDGKAALPRLGGMFAFAFYDRDTGDALLARDAFGIKPLYYLHRDRGLAFASEVRALRSFVPDREPAAAAVRDMLMWGSVPEPATLMTAVRQVPAGCFLEWNGGHAKVGRWHALKFGGDRPPADPIAATRAALLESVRRHLVSDVPVGIFLSGGIDSTAVLALAREVLGPKADLRTFSIGFDDPAYDESSIARRTADHFAAHHTEWRITAEEGRTEISGYLAAMDQPTIDGFNSW